MSVNVGLIVPGHKENSPRRPLSSGVLKTVKHTARREFADQAGGGKIPNLCRDKTVIAAKHVGDQTLQAL